ncbi:antibiotic biosynthesis monooxygenase [Pseudomonas oryzihabitans]|uniref:Antibiotic biosynthesis monooxygenase n=1 Tax=Pseudomonas oryzihabitans TaxID=47885 RepID=A0A2Z5A4J8_9PSED|nr:antibiotic biosynthesis monooxygenase [Pseudomonas oryzihabitans]AXA65163.1 antibiotic biosynthesis monooxygenase [Pseudomonas oryzihabitans]
MSAARGQDLQQARSRIVTLVIRHQPLADQQDAYQRWLQRAVTAGSAACGHLGVDVIPPAEEGAAFTTLVRFADVDQLQAWLASPERQTLIAEVAPLLREADAPEVHADAEFWFSPPRPGVRPPPAWKQAVLTYLVIAPLTMLIPPLWQPLFARYPALAGIVPSNLLITLCIVPLVVFLIMPRVSRLCAPWLNARSGAFSTPSTHRGEQP